ncbi:hypothetical protein [Microbacterium gubbeenense]|uniref:hypothetical protein n=1 Tax=Microbacterium TaxID=33882 RepID=UPI003F9E0418
MGTLHLKLLDLGDARISADELCERIDAQSIAGREDHTSAVEVSNSPRAGTTWIISFETSRIRPAAAHGLACRAGFLANVQTPEQTALDRHLDATHDAS